MMFDQGRAPHSDSRACCTGYSGASARAFDPTFRSPSRFGGIIPQSGAHFKHQVGRMERERALFPRSLVFQISRHLDF